MPGATPHEAVRAFLAPFHENLAILDGRGQIAVARKGSYRTGVDYYWMVGGGRGLALAGLGTFSASMRFRIIEVEPTMYDGATHRVTTLGYNYKLWHREHGGDVWRIHWHPDGVSPVQGPHMHVPPDLLVHRPTERITFEQAIRWCIADGARLTVSEDQADRMLAESEGLHKLYRRWSTSPDQPHAGTGP